MDTLIKDTTENVPFKEPATVESVDSVLAEIFTTNLYPVEEPVTALPVDPVIVEIVPIEKPASSVPVYTMVVETDPVEEPVTALPVDPVVVETDPVEEPASALPVDPMVVENIPVEEPASALPVDPMVVENIPVEKPVAAVPVDTMAVEDVPVEELAAALPVDPLVIETYYYPYDNPAFVNPRPLLPHYNPVYPNLPYNPYYGNHVHQNLVANFLNFGLNTVQNFVGLGLQAALGPFAPPHEPYNRPFLRHPYGYYYRERLENVKIIEDETRSQITPLIQCLKHEWGIENVERCYKKSTRTELIYKPLEQVSGKDMTGRKCWITPVSAGFLEYCFDLPAQKRVTARFIPDLSS